MPRDTRRAACCDSRCEIIQIGSDRPVPSLGHARTPDPRLGSIDFMDLNPSNQRPTRMSVVDDPKDHLSPTTIDNTTSYNFVRWIIIQSRTRVEWVTDGLFRGPIREEGGGLGTGVYLARDRRTGPRSGFELRAFNRATVLHFYFLILRIYFV